MSGPWGDVDMDNADSPRARTTGGGFKDHFSQVSGGYACYRPVYPPALFRYLVAIVPARDRAWDCATGTGQAALALRRYFREVIATDASREQIARAPVARGIRYRHAPAVDSGLENTSVDVVTVAQALHWFHGPAFFNEVRRVLRPRGILAAWCYQLARVDDEIDALVWHLYDHLLRDFWPPERVLIERAYADIDFPFSEVRTPRFQMTAHWDLPRMLGYLRTWSGVIRAQAHTGRDPVSVVEPNLRAAWVDPTRRRLVRWPLTLKVRRHTSGDRI